MAVKTRVVIEGIDELKDQLERIGPDILKAANREAAQIMEAGLSVAKSNIRPRGRKYDSGKNKAHPPGYLQSKVTTFTISAIRKGKQKVWASIGVPYRSGAAYYMPLVLGHKVKAHGRDTGRTAPAYDFLTKAYKAIQSTGKLRIVNAINKVIEGYRSSPPM